MKLWKMKKKFSTQRWYDPGGVYILQEKKPERYLYMFGTDCEWKNIITGEVISGWDSSFEQLPIEEKRTILIDIITK